LELSQYMYTGGVNVAHAAMSALHCVLEVPATGRHSDGWICDALTAHGSKLSVVMRRSAAAAATLVVARRQLAMVPVLGVLGVVVVVEGM